MGVARHSALPPKCFCPARSGPWQVTLRFQFEIPLAFLRTEVKRLACIGCLGGGGFLIDRCSADYVHGANRFIIGIVIQTEGFFHSTTSYYYSPRLQHQCRREAEHGHISEQRSLVRAY